MLKLISLKKTEIVFCFKDTLTIKGELKKIGQNNLICHFDHSLQNIPDKILLTYSKFFKKIKHKVNYDKIEIDDFIAVITINHFEYESILKFIFDNNTEKEKLAIYFDHFKQTDADLFPIWEEVQLSELEYIIKIFLKVSSVWIYPKDILFDYNGPNLCLKQPLNECQLIVEINDNQNLNSKHMQIVFDVLDENYKKIKNTRNGLYD